MRRASQPSVSESVKSLFEKSVKREVAAGGEHEPGAKGLLKTRGETPKQFDHWPEMPTHLFRVRRF